MLTRREFLRLKQQDYEKIIIPIKDSGMILLEERENDMV
jgi:hypothetical protein